MGQRLVHRLSHGLCSTFVNIVELLMEMIAYLN